MIAKISISQIKKLGKNIRRGLRNGEKPSEESLELLQNYRVQHQEALRSTFDFLVQKSKIHYKGSLVVYRLKRIDTIIRKIKRYPTMDLSKMQDIAGCRTIVNSVNQIYNIVEEFKQSEGFDVLDTDDYIKDIRDTGYSCVHIVVKPKESSNPVEIQIRTQTQHHWATLVEITDLLFGIKLKEGQDHPDLYNFHRLLAKSRDSELTIEEMADLVRLDRKHSLIFKITNLFKSNYYQSLRRWMKSLEINKDNSYLLMELDDSLSPFFSFFETFEIAEMEYFKKFSHAEPEMVLIHMNKPDFGKLGLAYSNYVLTSHPSVRKYLGILRILICEYKKEQHPQFKELHKYYQELIFQIKTSFNSELDYMNGVLSRKSQLSETYIILIVEWRDNLSERIVFLTQKDESFKEKLENTEPKFKIRKFWKWLNS